MFTYESHERKVLCLSISYDDTLSHSHVDRLFLIGVFFYFDPQNGTLFEAESVKDVNSVGPVLCTC